MQSVLVYRSGHVKTASRVKLHSDSAYLIDTMNKGWLAKWEKNGWKKADKKPVKNVDLWRELLEAVEPYEVEWVKVRGHSGVGANERCTPLSNSPYRGVSEGAHDGHRASSGDRCRISRSRG